tara:strand:- start:889 stop:1251 length:363 start_codon:yes stop_codon:yes gene_type:complete
MKLTTILITMAMGSLTAQNLNELNSNVFYESRSQYPKAIKPFVLTYYDIRDSIQNYQNGKIEVQFEVDEKGNVIDPHIVDTFNIDLNAVVLDKVRQMKYHPARQNGVAVKVGYSLPIVFK